MSKSILSSVFLSIFLFASSALAQDITATCDGTVIVTIGVDGPDKIMAVNAKFTMKTKGKTSTFTLENKFAPAIKGTGSESGNEDLPWNLEAKDADGLAFKGGLTTVKGAYPGDTNLYMILELKNEKIVISGPMSCVMK